MFDRPEEFFESHTLVMRVAVKLKPGRRRIPGVWHLLMHRLAALRGVGAGTPHRNIEGMEDADMEANVWYDEPDVMRGLLDALECEKDVASFEIVMPRKAPGQIVGH